LGVFFDKNLLKDKASSGQYHSLLADLTQTFKAGSVLMQNPKQTLTREQILAKLWDVAGEFVDDNTLSVYIRRLREKVERDPSRPEYIITMRGMGYKWDRPQEGTL
jgi:two-component system response regulator RegX3